MHNVIGWVIPVVNSTSLHILKYLELFIQLLCKSCEAFDGHKEVLSALTRLAIKTAERYKFKDMVQRLMSRDSVQYQVKTSLTLSSLHLMYYYPAFNVLYEFVLSYLT